MEYNAVASNSIQLPVATTAPGIFTADASGHGQAAVLNQDYSLNSATRPAAKGSIVMVYATGAGQTMPLGEDGRIVGVDALPTPVQSVSGRIGGINADILYAGAAPGLVNGLLQVNARIPEVSTLVGAQPLIVNIGTTPSQAGVLVWIASDP